MLGDTRRNSLMFCRKNIDEMGEIFQGESIKGKAVMLSPYAEPQLILGKAKNLLGV